jgi:ABC-type uncharacterized transport system permease subunit
LSAAAARYGRAAAGLVAAIWASAWPAQFALDFLRERNLLRVTIALLGLAALAGAAVALRRHRAAPREWATLAAVVAVYAVVALLPGVYANAQERIHLVEYGAVALLFRQGLRVAPRSEARAAGLALLLTALAGLGDEVVQAVTPNRHFDWRDVRLNAISGALALAAAMALAAARRPAAERAGAA